MQLGWSIDCPSRLLRSPVALAAGCSSGATTIVMWGGPSRPTSS